MEIKNTNITPLGIERTIRGSIQTGTIPPGVSSDDSKYPLNISDVTLGNPNGSHNFHPLYPIQEIGKDFTMKVSGDWSNSVKPGDPLMIKRGNVKNFYIVKKTYYNSNTSENTITLFSAREDVKPFTPFLGSSGYPSVSSDVLVLFNKGVENPNLRNVLLRSFEYKMLPTNTDTFSLKLSWDLDPSVKVTRLRWRTAPRVTNVSTLNFSLLSGGLYKDVPKVEIISDTGRSANVNLRSTINSAYIEPGNEGNSYTSASILVTGGEGSGAVLEPVISPGGQIVSVNVINGGSGYTSKPTVSVVGDGEGATVSIILQVNSLICTDQGGGYLSVPTISVDNSNLHSGSPATIGCSLSLDNTGSVDYIRVLNGGTGYVGASVSISGSSTSQNAIAIPVIENGTITAIKIVAGGRGYTAASVSITPIGAGGTGASAIANVDLYSNWVYESPLYTEKETVISGFKTNLPYEIQIITSSDELFRGLVKYSDSYTFQYVK